MISCCWKGRRHPGGRVRSHVTPDGYTLDRGFQVLLDSYPAARRHLDLAALEPALFRERRDPARRGPHLDGRRSATASGRLSGNGVRRHVFRRRQGAAGGAGGGTARHAGRLAAGRSARRETMSARRITSGGADFSPAIIERFFRPFFGGVFLDEKLATSAGLFRYYLKKFATGRALLPAAGIGEIPRQLAATLPPGGKLRLGCRVSAWFASRRRGGRRRHRPTAKRLPANASCSPPMRPPRPACSNAARRPARRSARRSFISPARFRSTSAPC